LYLVFSFFPGTIHRTFWTHRVYQKPTVTDAIIPTNSCHANEHKQSAITFLKHRNKTYFTTSKNKQQEDAVIEHIVCANQYNTATANRNTNDYHCDHGPENPPELAKFTYVGHEIRSVTNLFKHTTVDIAFNTIHNIERLLSPAHHHQQSDKLLKKRSTYRR
jgi:hypothetical protein